MSIERAQFPHRVNRDGTFDSICRVCFRTIAHEIRERDLAGFESAHVCAPLDMALRTSLAVPAIGKRKT